MKKGDDEKAYTYLIAHHQISSGLNLKNHFGFVISEKVLFCDFIEKKF